MAKILVADDNSNIQKMVGLALKDQGIDVVAVGNGEAAVRKISDLKPDLVLADVFMPVRNGYEVCKYVKDDSALKHIPVILLVGAFDPLDEQEAQRVGADGVLKKPFVPPDPLISMVKSALARAGVPLGHAPVAEKTAEAPKHNAAELLSPAVSKLAALSSVLVPEVETRPVPEEFPPVPEQVKIQEGHEPLAFGSLLETPEAEDDAAFIPAKPVTELGSAQNWDTDEAEEEVEVAEEASGSGWRPGGDLTALETEDAEIENKVKDWREKAFHDSSPARTHRSSQHWEPAVAEPEFAASTELRAVAVTTLDPKPAEVPAFSGNAWAAALAAGVEEKLTETREALTSSVGSEPISETKAEVQSEAAPEAANIPPVQQDTKAENSWYSVTASPWDIEAKRATRLASTWDKAVTELPAVLNEPVAAEPTEADVEENNTGAADPSEDFVHETSSEDTTALLHEVTFESSEETASHSSFATESMVNETQEVESYQPPAPESFEKTWVSAPPESVNQYVETSSQEYVIEQAVPPVEAVQEPLAAGVREEAPEATYEPTPSAAEAPNMDELVARVLSRMNPDVLQKVTRDILKPVIEALIQDELNTKKP